MEAVETNDPLCALNDSEHLLKALQVTHVVFNSLTVEVEFALQFVDFKLYFAFYLKHTAMSSSDRHIWISKDQQMAGFSFLINSLNSSCRVSAGSDEFR